MRILIVDDYEDSTEMLAVMIEMLGHDAVVALDGMTALAVAQFSPPDAVLLDIGLPDISGLELAPRLRALMPPGARIVALSGWAEPADRVRGLAAGCDQYLCKPASPREICTALSLLI